MLLKCERYKDFVPQIGRLKAIKEASITVQWLEGEYEGKWKFWKDRGKIIQESFPRRALIREISFTDSMELSPEEVNKIKDCYKDVELV